MIKAKLIQTELRLWELGYNLLVCEMDTETREFVAKELGRLQDVLGDFVELAELAESQKGE